MQSTIRFCAVAYLPCVPSWSRAGNAPRPNIIFSMTDDLGDEDLGGDGQKVIATPDIDCLSASGVRFTQAYAGGPVCVPCLVNVPRTDTFSCVTPFPVSPKRMSRDVRTAGENSYQWATFRSGGEGGGDDVEDPLRPEKTRFMGYVPAHLRCHQASRVRRNITMLNIRPRRPSTGVRSRPPRTAPETPFSRAS